MSKHNIQKVDIYELFKKPEKTSITTVYETFQILTLELINYVKSFYKKNVKYKVKFLLNYIKSMVNKLIQTNYDSNINSILLKIKKYLLKNQNTIKSVGYEKELSDTIDTIDDYRLDKKTKLINEIINETDTIVNDLNTIIKKPSDIEKKNNYSETSDIEKRNNYSETSDIEKKLDQLDLFK